MVSSTSGERPSTFSSAFTIPLHSLRSEAIAFTSGWWCDRLATIDLRSLPSAHSPRARDVVSRFRRYEFDRLSATGLGCRDDRISATVDGRRTSIPFRSDRVRTTLASAFQQSLAAELEVRLSTIIFALHEMRSSDDDRSRSFTTEEPLSKLSGVHHGGDPLFQGICRRITASQPSFENHVAATWA